MFKIITTHNAKILNPYEDSNPSYNYCIIEDCFFNDDVKHKASINYDKEEKIDFGSTQNSLKTRWYSHKESLFNKWHKNSTSLSRYNGYIKDRFGVLFAMIR